MKGAMLLRLCKSMPQGRDNDHAFATARKHGAPAKHTAGQDRPWHTAFMLSPAKAWHPAALKRAGRAPGVFLLNAGDRFVSWCSVKHRRRAACHLLIWRSAPDGARAWRSHAWTRFWTFSRKTSGPIDRPQVIAAEAPPTVEWAPKKRRSMDCAGSRFADQGAMVLARRPRAMTPQEGDPVHPLKGAA
jgi:hypothetical protein